MITNDTFPSLQMSSCNLNSSNSNFHHRNLYINLPSPSSILAPTHTNEVRNSRDTMTAQSITNNDSSLVGNHVESNDDSLSNSNIVHQRQESYQAPQGANISNSPDLLSNTTNNTN